MNNIMEKRIFYVESPGQFINAMEAVYAFQQKWLLIVRFNGEEVNDSQLDKVINFYREQNTPIFCKGKIVKVNGFLNFLNVFTLAILRNKFKGVYIGCHKSKFLMIFKIFKIKFCLLDDGIATMVYVRNTRENEHKKSGGKLSFIGGGRFSLFTSLFEQDLYDFEFTQHEYAFLKSMSRPSALNKDVYFYGAKYIEAGIVSEQVYICLLESVLDYFDGMNVCYLPHRGESFQRLERYKKMGFKLLIPNYPSELELITSSANPEIVAGFFSATLFSTYIILPEIKIVSFKLPHEYIRNGSDTLEYIYKFFSRFSTIVDMKCNL